MIIFKWSTLIYHNTPTVSYIVTSNGTLKFYSISSTKYSTSTLLNKTCITSLNSSRRILINTILRIINITNCRIYKNTTIRTFNSTSSVYSICFSLYCWRILINTIFRRRIITNCCIYINTTIRTFNCTICQNTIIISFKWSTWIYINTSTIIWIITFNSTIKIYSTSYTMYSSRRILINTILRIINITNSRIYINTIFRTFNSTIHINTIIIIFKLSTLIY